MEFYLHRKQLKHEFDFYQHGKKMKDEVEVNIQLCTLHHITIINIIKMSIINIIINHLDRENNHHNHH